LPARFPAIVDDEGKPTAADVEFAFVGGKLALLQIRPFLESRRARASVYLHRMDDGLRGALSRTVRLSEAPKPGSEHGAPSWPSPRSPSARYRLSRPPTPSRATSRRGSGACSEYASPRRGS